MSSGSSHKCVWSRYNSAMQQRQLEDTTTTSATRYDEQTLRQAIRLADRLQSEQKERYSADDIEKIAAEIGVQPEFVRKALNEIEDKHDAVAPTPKQSAPPVAQQVGQALQQATKSAQVTTGNLIQQIAKRLDEASLEEMQRYVTIWWSTAWVLLPIMDKLSGGFDDVFMPLSAIIYVGGGIYLSSRLDKKRKLERLAKREAKAAAGVAPPVRYSVQQSGVSREELLAQMVELQRRLEGERIRKTFLSIDVANSSEMKRSADDLVVEYCFNQYRRFVEEIITAEGGVMQSAAGDGAMAMFSDDRAAVRAALRLQNELPQFNAQHNRLSRLFHIRCGINAGEIAIPHGTPIGHLQSAVIDRAAALQKSAQIDDIVVSGDLSSVALAELGRYGRHTGSPEGGVPAFSWKAGF